MKSLTSRALFVSIAAAVPLTILAQTPLVTALAPVATSPIAVEQAQTPSAGDDILKREAYQTPPKELADAVLAPRYLNDNLSNLSPDKKYFLKMIGDGPVIMKTFSKPFDELGGVFIDYKANRSRTLTISNSIGIQLISATDGTKKSIQIPAGARVSNATWSPDGHSIAFFVNSEDATNIWIADVATLQSRQLTTSPVLATFVTNFDFTDDGKSIATVLPPDGRAPRPMEMAPVPTGPEVKVAAGQKASLRTFPSLMTTPQDFALLEVARDRPTRAHRRRDEVGEEGRVAGDDSRDRHLARRPVRPRDAHDRAVLVHRARLELRPGRRGVGPDGQAAGEDHRSADQSRRNTGRPQCGSGRGGAGGRRWRSRWPRRRQRQA